MTETIERIRTGLVARIDARDRAGAVSVALDAVRSGELSVPELYDICCALLKGVGASWQAGETEVWEEHYATATVRTIVEACEPLVLEHAATPNGRAVVLATPSDEYHDLGLRMIADRFALAGWSVHYLGASLPARELIAAVRETGADAVVLSASTHFHRVSLRSYVDELHASCPGVRVWVGGAAFAVETEHWAPDELLTIADIPTLADGMA